MNDVIEPTFPSDADRLTFLSRLWGVTITAKDVADWEAYKLLRPTKLLTQTESEYSERFRLWNEGRYDPLRRAQYVWAKWESYRLGKVKPLAEAWLSNKPNPNRSQMQQAVLLQLQDKFADKLARVNAAKDLLPLVTGIVW